jgi:ankyrin repeat protein
MVAIFRKKKEAFRALFPHSSIRACDFFRNTAFIAAAANGDIEALEALIAHPDNNPHAKNGDGHTALHRACYFGEMASIEWLLENTGLKIGDIDKKGNNGLHLACLGAQIATTRYLMAKVKKSSQLLVPNHEGNKPNALL